MAQAILTDGAWVELTPPYDFPVTVTVDGVPVPLHLTHAFVASLDADQLAEFNIATIVEPGEPPEGQYLAGSTLIDVAGEPVRDPVWEDIPPPAVPEFITAYQAARQNVEEGNDVAATQAAIDASGNEHLKAYFKTRARWYRADDEIEDVRLLFALSPEQMDTFFINAKVWPE